MSNIIDRRQNSNPQASNRKKFLDRYKDVIKDAVQESIRDKKIKDFGDSDTETKVRTKDVREPQFSKDYNTGDKDWVVPSAGDRQVGDLIHKDNSDDPRMGHEPGFEDIIGEDSFIFNLSKDELIDLLLDGLALPNLEKKLYDDFIQRKALERAGFAKDGIPNRVSLPRTMTQALSRQIAAKAAIDEEIEELQKLLYKINSLSRTRDRSQEVEAIHHQIAELQEQRDNIVFIDDYDLRYKNYELKNRPATKIVMICIMDVSGSMMEEHKTAAKGFYILLYLFLSKFYGEVEVVFIRHHTVAKECTEHEFFHSTETGGTIVSSALKVATDVIAKRYNPNEYNIYIAQTTDGDNWGSDNDQCFALYEELTSVAQHCFYVQIGAERGEGLTAYLLNNHICGKFKNFSLAKLHDGHGMPTLDGLPAVFYDLFGKGAHNVE